MPPKTTHKKPYKRKTYAKKPSKMSMSKTSPGAGINKLYPSRLKIPLKFVVSSGINSGAVSSTFGTSNLLRLNAIHDPLAGRVLDVQGFDQLKGIYGKYKVTKAIVDITFNNPESDGLYAGVRVHKSGGSDALAGEKVGEAIMKKWTWGKPVNDSGSQVIHYKRTWDIGNVEGLTATQFNADYLNYNSLILSQPNLVIDLELCVANTQSGTPRNLQYLATVMYIVELSDRKVLANSSNP